MFFGSIHETSLSTYLPENVWTNNSKTRNICISLESYPFFFKVSYVGVMVGGGGEFVLLWFLGTPWVRIVPAARRRWWRIFFPFNFHIEKWLIGGWGRELAADLRKHQPCYLSNTIMYMGNSLVKSLMSLNNSCRTYQGPMLMEQRLLCGLSQIIERYMVMISPQKKRVCVVTD